MGMLMGIKPCQIRGQYSRSSPEFLWSEERPTKIQATTRPDCLWLEIRIGMSKAAKKRERQEWAIEKPKLVDARKSKGVYFIHLEDEES